MITANEARKEVDHANKRDIRMAKIDKAVRQASFKGQYSTEVELVNLSDTDLTLTINDLKKLGFEVDASHFNHPLLCNNQNIWMLTICWKPAKRN